MLNRDMIFMLFGITAPPAGENIMLFVKFGKKVNLERLKDGIVHFGRLSTYITDPTNFRGDPREASLLVDTKRPIIINGYDISPYVMEAKQTFVGFDSILSFSASMLDHNNCHAIDNELYTVNKEFIEEMRQFGDSFLVIDAGYFISCIRDALKSHSCNYTYHPIFYCDKADHEAIVKHFKDSGKIDDPYEYCFVKDPTPYKKQNEWRIIIHDIDNEFADMSNNGLNIQTGFRDRMPIFETSVLHTMRISKNFLE